MNTVSKSLCDRKNSKVMEMVEKELRLGHELYAETFIEWVNKIDEAYIMSGGLIMSEPELMIAYCFFTKGIGCGSAISGSIKLNSN